LIEHSSHGKYGGISAALSVITRGKLRALKITIHYSILQHRYSWVYHTSAYFVFCIICIVSF